MARVTHVGGSLERNCDWADYQGVRSRRYSFRLNLLSLGAVGFLSIICNKKNTDFN